MSISMKKLVSIVGLLALWVLFTYEGITSAIAIWWGNEIFNHGFLIVPGSFYLLYLDRKQLLSTSWETSLLPLPFIAGACFLYIVGIAGDIQLFMHVATFSLLPLLVWTVIGNTAAMKVWFPLVFMLFSVPVGEELIPYLQEIAADGSVALLQLVGIPLYRNGLYIEIPQGRFLVAEACSGVSFFIASFVIGSVYAYLNFRTTFKKASFVVISLILPIAANIVRIFGIIIIGYLSDMEHAVGADHLIYGWFFFAFVIICLLGLGELLRDDMSDDSKFYSTHHWRFRMGGIFAAYSVLVLSLGWLWMLKVQSGQQLDIVVSPSLIEPNKTCEASNVGLSPQLASPDTLEQVGVELGDLCSGTMYKAWFSGRNNELVSGLNRAYDDEKWNLLNMETQSVYFERLNVTLQFSTLTSPLGQQQRFSQWYEVNGKIFTSSIKAKLYQIYLRLIGESVSGYFVVFAVGQNSDISEVERALRYAQRN